MLLPRALAPAVQSHSHGTKVRIDSWLADSGTSLDAVNRADVEEHAQQIRHGDPLMLDTANGTTRADKVLDMFLGPLGEHISPYVLDSTPNILSLGTRIVDQGYTWVWPGWSLWPYLIHPTTGDYTYISESRTTHLTSMSFRARGLPTALVALLPFARSPYLDGTPLLYRAPPQRQVHHHLRHHLCLHIVAVRLLLIRLGHMAGSGGH